MDDVACDVLWIDVFLFATEAIGPACWIGSSRCQLRDSVLDVPWHLLAKQIAYAEQGHTWRAQDGKSVQVSQIELIPRTERHNRDVCTWCEWSRGTKLLCRFEVKSWCSLLLLFYTRIPATVELRQRNIYLLDLRCTIRTARNRLRERLLNWPEFVWCEKQRKQFSSVRRCVTAGRLGTRLQYTGSLLNPCQTWRDNQDGTPTMETKDVPIYSLVSDFIRRIHLMLSCWGSENRLGVMLGRAV